MTYTLPPNPNRYITSTKYGYKVQRTINGKPVYAGTYKTLTEARKERDYMEQIRWDYNNII